MFFEGECTEKDIHKSIEWFTKAADQGLMGSATTLAMIYEEGKLVPQDLEKSQYWYKKAGDRKTLMKYFPFFMELSKAACTSCRWRRSS